MQETLITYSGIVTNDHNVYNAFCAFRINIGNSLYNHVINFEIFFENLKLVNLQYKNIYDLLSQWFSAKKS